MTRVLASATVDRIANGSAENWLVTVDGRPEGTEPLTAQRRVYRIAASSDSLAAQEGIRRFVEELESSDA